jgi:hypothetical protein
MNNKYSGAYRYQTVVFIVKMIFLTWAILVVSFILYEAKGSIVSLLKNEVKLDVSNFIKFLSILTGKPLYLRVYIPYLPYPYNYVDIYEPVIFTLLCFSPFWISNGIFIGAWGNTLKEVIFSALTLFSTFILFCVIFNCIYSIEYTLIGFLLLIITAAGTFIFKLQGKNT